MDFVIPVQVHINESIEGSGPGGFTNDPRMQSLAASHGLSVEEVAKESIGNFLVVMWDQFGPGLGDEATITIGGNDE